MKQTFHYLRFSWAIFFGVSSVLLIALWIESCRHWISVNGLTPNNYKFCLSAVDQRLRFAAFNREYENGFTGERVPPWSMFHHELRKPVNLRMVNAPLREIGLGFAGSQDKYGVVIIVPLWLPTITAFVLAVVPYSTRAWWQFSLRTLLITTTAVAVGLWFIVWMAGR